MDQDTASKYCGAIWDVFLEKTHQSPVRLMNAAEWELLRTWMHSGLPLRIVLRAFQDTEVKGRVGSLRYFERSVRDAAEKWQRALA